MLKKFLRRCHNAVSRDTAQQTLAARFSLFLSPLLQNWAYIPFTNWAPGPEFLCHIANEICIRQRRTIVEFGSGVSTILMARLAKINALDVQIYSIDQNQDWQDRVAAICAADKTLGPVHFLCRPARLEDGKHDDAPVDMVIVDGKAEATAESRATALDFVAPHLGPSFAIFLHDTDRSAEQAIFDGWKKKIACTHIITADRYAVLLNDAAMFDTTPQNLC